MDKETNRMKLAYWSGIIKEANASGMKISKWCDMNQISRRKYYYWHKKVMHDTYTLAVKTGLISEEGTNPPDRELPVTTEFAELSLPKTLTASEQSVDPGISIKWNDFTVSIDHGFSEGELIRVLKVMQYVK